MTAEEALKEQLATEQAAHAETKEAIAKLQGELDAANEGLQAARQALLRQGVELGEERAAKEAHQKIAQTAETTNAGLRNQIAKAHAALDEVVNAK